MDKVVFVDSDKNNKIDTAIITTYTGAQVTYVGSSQITFNGKSYKFEDDKIDKTIEKDDYAVLSKNLYEDCNNIVKADVLNTKLTGFKEKTGYVQYQLDGKWYNMASVDGDVSTGDTVKAYVFNGVVLDLDSEDGDGSYPSNVAIVIGKGGDSLNGDQAKIRYFNGEVKTVTIDDDSTVTPVIGSAYKVSAAGSDIKFEALVANRKYNGYTFVSNNKSADVANDKIGTTKVDDSAVIVLYDGKGASKQITGKQYNALVASDVVSGNNCAVFTKETNGLDRVRMASVKVPSTSVSGKSNDNYAYIISDGVENANNKTAITIWTGSENKDVVVDTGYSKGEYVKGMLIGYSSIDENGIINDVDVIGNIKSATAFPTSSVNTSTLYRGSNKANVSNYIVVNDGKLNVTADTKVLVVDSDADSKSDIGIAYNYGDKLPKASKNGDDYLVNAMWVMDEAGTDDKDIEVLVIDSTGAFKGFKVDDVNAASVSATTSGAPVYGTASDVTVTATFKNFTAKTTELSVDAASGLTVTGMKVSTSATTAAGTYTVGVKGTDKDGNTVSTTVKVTVAKATVTPSALTAPSAPAVGTRFNTFKPTFTVAANAGYTLGTPVVTLDGVDITTAPLSTFADGDVLTITVPVVADANHTVTSATLITTVTVAQ